MATVDGRPKFTEMPICMWCMEKMEHKCTLTYVKARHQKAVVALEKHLANREPNEVGEDLKELVMQVEAMKGCIITREEILGIRERIS